MVSLEELMEIWPSGITILCSSIEERRIVTEIALAAGSNGCPSGFSERVMAGTDDTDYLHPQAVWRDKRCAPYITYCHSTIPRESEYTMTFDEFIDRVYRVNEPITFECGDLDSLLA